MRRRRPPAEAAASAPDPQYVEDWVEPTEPPPVLDGFVPSWRADLLPGEQPQAVPWRVLAEERVDAARREARRSPEPCELVDGIDVVRTRTGLPPGVRDASQREPAGPSWDSGARCLWRDIEAFLAKIPRDVSAP